MKDTNPFQNPWFCDAAALAAQAPTAEAAQAIRQFFDWGKDFAALAGKGQPIWLAPAAMQLESLRTAFAERYLALFAPATATLSAAAEQGHPATAARLRFQRACQRQGEAFAAIAQDACGRLIASLAAAGPPITSLKELHALWIECGERAFADAAHGEAFAATQAELIAAYVELRA